MWGTLLTNVATAAATHFLGNGSSDNTQNKSQSGNYNVRGYINNLPVDLEVESTRQGSGSSRFTRGRITQVSSDKSNYHETNQHLGLMARPVSSNSQIVPLSKGSPSCQNCNNSCSSNTKTGKKQQGNFTKKRDVDDNKYCKIVIPQQGNYEISIKKFESNFAEMSLSNPKSVQNSQKGGSNNTQRQNFNKNKQQNVNQSNWNRNNTQKANENQARNRNNNQNKPYVNQNKPNPGCNQAKSQNMQLVKYQNQTTQNCGDQFKVKKDKIKHQKPGELKVMKYKSGGPTFAQQNSAFVNYQSTWMYLGRLKAGTTEVEIKNYLQQKFPGHNFTVESLPLYREAKLSSFKVKVENRILDEFQKLENWPKGANITKFIDNFRS